MLSCSVESDSATLWTITCLAPLSMGFPRQEYWSGLPFLSPGHLPNPEIEPVSSALTVILFTTESPGKPLDFIVMIKKHNIMNKIY